MIEKREGSFIPHEESLSNIEEGPEAKEIKEMEDEITQVVETVEDVKDPEGVLTEEEKEKKEGLFNKILEIDRKFLEFYGSFLKETHPPVSDLEISFSGVVARREGGGGNLQKIYEEIMDNFDEYRDYRELTKRLLFECHRNEDYYRRHKKTDWKVSHDIVQRGERPENPRESNKYEVFTRIRAKSTSKLEPRSDEVELTNLQCKAEVPGMLHGLALPFQDALEPVFGLSLPPSISFESKEEAEKFRDKLDEVIGIVAQAAYGDRIEVVTK